MDVKIFHGEVKAKDFADALVGRFNQSNLTATQDKSGDQYIVQISSRQYARSGGQTALGVTIQQNDDSVTIKVGKQTWLGIAASLGSTLIQLGRNPLSIIHRLDDVAQDLQNLQLDDQVWDVIEEVAETLGASFEISKRLRRTGCAYCNTANPVGQPRCIACGAPLGGSQPVTCNNCGYVAAPGDVKCTNCRQSL